LPAILLFQAIEVEAAAHPIEIVQRFSHGLPP
jgi:hypothetical protein